MRRRRRLGWLLALGAVLCTLTGLPAAGPAFASPVTLTPGTIWHDTTGNRLQAHGGGAAEGDLQLQHRPVREVDAH